MTKLGKFLSELVITQTGHSTVSVDGLAINQTAFDFGARVGIASNHLFAPLDCEVRRNYLKSPDYQSFYFISLPDGSEIFVLHASPSRMGFFKKGEIISDRPYSTHPSGPHYHVAIRVKGSWQRILDYTDRSARLFWWSYLNTKSPITDWSTYPDKSLLFTTQDMATVHNSVIIKSKDGSKIRSDTNTASTQLGLIPAGADIKLDTITNVTGQDIGGNPTWLRVSYNNVVGWISEATISYIQITPPPVVVPPVDYETLKNQNLDYKNRLNEINGRSKI